MSNNLEQLERLELTIQVIKTDRIIFVRITTQSYDLSLSTLQKRLNDIKERV